MVDLEIGFADLIQVERTTIDIRTLEGVLALTRRGDETRTVELQSSFLPDQAELDGEPEEAREPSRIRLVRSGEGRPAVGLEEVGEHGIGVERHMPEDVVEDVGLG